ncbi:MAG TPA: GNAT family N-acetyltransferase [Candidatus Sulfomarinibacteraceae bacterium]|nr:GNAT family N-acetyltransferase [Candidatus Sulfomarinibacteraceae bacterium]
MSQPVARGRVLHVNVSPGGVPKLPVAGARVGPLGLDGDGHTAYWSHGGPLRAVSLLAIEAIERVQADGHPIEPGSTGENLTTVGIELARLPVATRLAIGDELLLEVTAPAMPCDTIRGSFRDGKSGRISILLHRDDSRIYARVLREGTVRTGDPIEVLAPDADAGLATHEFLSRLEGVDRHSAVARWSAAELDGHAIEWSDRGDLAYAVAPDLPGPIFNSVLGMRVVPNLLPLVLERYDRTGASAYVAMESTPWPGAEPVATLETSVAAPEDVLAAADSTGTDPAVLVREIGPDEAGRWADIHIRADPWMPDPVAAAWRATTKRVAETAGHHLFLAELDGRPVGVGLLVTRRRAGLVRAGAVLPEVRGQGIQRALIRARAAAAAAHGCDVVTSKATPGTTSARNLARLGFRAISTSHVYRYDPPPGR